MRRLWNILAEFVPVDALPMYFGLLVGGAALLVFLLVARNMRTRIEVGRRMSRPVYAAPRSLTGGGAPLAASGQAKAEEVFLRAARIFVPTERAALSEIRKSLVNAGYFAPMAVPVFFGIRIVAALVLPIMGMLVATLIPSAPSFAPPLIAALLAALGLVVPPIFLDWRRNKMRDTYRQVFPDLMDVLVVCVESGQSLQGSIERVSKEFARSCPELGANLHIVSLELRAGRDLNSAMTGLTERLGIDEVKSLTLMLKQSEELGTSLADTLRVYSDEMRDKRMMRAEAKANALPVKMVAPLAICMFPVILVVILLPLLVRIKNTPM